MNINDAYENQFKQGRIQDAGDFPKVILLDTVSYCNLKCSMCVHSQMKRKKGIMSWGLFTKIIDEIAEKNKDTRIWMVFFGDPFIIKKKKPTIFDMIAYAKNKGLTDVVVNSNGVLMDEESAKELIKCGLDAIYFGVDAFSPEVYVQLRVGGNYEKTVNNIKNLIRLKKEIQAAKPEVYVQFVEMDINEGEVKDFVKFWKGQGANVKVRPKISWGGLIEAPNLVLGNDQRFPCHWAMQTMSITDTGKVVLCACDLDARFVVGDITENTIKEVWNGKLKELRQMHISKRYDELPEFCRDCGDWQSARAEYIE